VLCAAVPSGCGGHAAPGAGDSGSGGNREDASAWTADGAVGGACQNNADCVGSPADLTSRPVRCVGKDLYCLDGLCHAECRDSCTQLRTDVNPCPAPRICVPITGLGIAFCSLTPPPCQAAADCPTYRPPVDGSSADWTCDQGICRYPGLEPATH
jgi:hypothetical protein